MPARRRLLVALSALAAVFAGGTLGYHYLVGADLGLAAYQTIITLSTVGFREEWEFNSVARLWTAGIIVVGIAVVTLAFASLQAMIIGGELRSLLGRRKLQHQIAKLSGHYIVCGYGRMGMLTSENLRLRGKKVVVIEKDNQRTVVAEEHGMAYVLGDATDEKILCEAGIERAGGLVSALRSDADNVFVTLTAAGLRKDIPIIARAEFFESEPKLKRAGATHVVCPHEIGAIRMATLLARPAITQLVDLASMGSEWEIDEAIVAADSRFVGQSFRELRFRENCGAMVVAVRSADGETTMSPGAEYVVRAGDVLVVIGPAGIANVLMSFDSSLRRRKT